MSQTLLELAVVLVLLVVAWQIGVIVAPRVLRAIRGLKDEVEQAADAALSDTPETHSNEQRKERTNGTHR
jgi:nitrogen fixation/metabolism regulation signal transduction histidine kinase